MSKGLMAPSRALDGQWTCRWCGSSSAMVVLDLGLQPASDQFPRPTDPEPDPLHPLAMVQCDRCHLAQLETDPTTPDEPRGAEPRALVAQAKDAIARIAAAELLPVAGALLEHRSPHGGSWIPELTARGLSEVEIGPADVVVDAFGMMHDADQRAALRSRVDELGPAGLLFLQFHSVAAILRQEMWNALRHGHFAYYSTPVVVAMAKELGLDAIGAWEFDLYGGTVMLAFTRNGLRSVQVDRLIERETELGVLDPVIVSGLQTSVTASVIAIRRYLDECASAGLTMAGYGAASRSVALLAMAGVGPADLVGIGDASPTKIGRCLPGARIPVISAQQLVDLRPDRVLLFVPDLLDEVRAALPDIELDGGRWVVLDPHPTVVPPVNASVAWTRSWS